MFHNRKSTMLLGICLFAASLLLFLFVTHYWMFAIGKLLQGLGAGGVATMGYVLVADTSPPHVLGSRVCINIYNNIHTKNTQNIKKLEKPATVKLRSYYINYLLYVHRWEGPVCAIWQA